MYKRDDLKPLDWVGSSKKDLKRLPEGVQERFTQAFFMAMAGDKHRDAKPLKDFGPRVLEIIYRQYDKTLIVLCIRFIQRRSFMCHTFFKRKQRMVG